MDKSASILVLKLTDGEDLPTDRLAQLANGHWKVNAIRVQSVKRVIVMIHQEVKADFEMSDTITLERSVGRITNLGLKDAMNDTGLVGEILDYRTHNPATIKTLGALQKLIK